MSSHHIYKYTNWSLDKPKETQLKHELKSNCDWKSKHLQTYFPTRGYCLQLGLFHCVESLGHIALIVLKHSPLG